MIIEKETQGTMTIIRLKERIDSSVAKEFEEKMMGVAEEQPKGMLVDFSGLDYISSAGLRVLLMTAKKMKSLNGKLALCSMKPNIYEVFEVSGFATMLSVFPDNVAGMTFLNS